MHVVSRLRPSHLALIGALGVWVSASALVMAAMWERNAAPSALGEGPAHWPTHTSVTLATDRPTIVLFAHPRCPCSHATVSELSRALTAAPNARVEVRLYVPRDTDASWAQTSLWTRAAALPGAQVFVDVDGAEARRFDAQTSGLVVAYAPDGRRLFHGGVTGARGHEGNNAGREALVQALTNDREGRAAVYGCSL